MSIATLILGESGSGKSASLRNMDPATTGLIQTTAKPLPFKAHGWKPVVTDNWQRIIEIIQKAGTYGKDKIVIDDFQYVMANEFMRRGQEKGYEKFTDIATQVWRIFKAAAEGPPHLRVYLLSHTDTDQFGQTKMKTIGKLLDEKITPEGMFTIVLRTQIMDGKNVFLTTNSGHDTTKAPMGMFADAYIENDLTIVDKAICEYYGITTPPPKPTTEQKA